MGLESDKRKFLQPETVALLNSMALRARMIVEGYIIGHHRSPYHGFSVEFAEVITVLVLIVRVPQMGMQN